MAHTALNPSFVEEIRKSFARQPVMQVIGAELGQIEPGLVEIKLPYRSDLTQQHGYLHAGIVSTIADTASGYAAFSLMPAGSEVLCVEFKVNLLRPARGQLFVARAEVVKAGKTLTVVRADVIAISKNKEEELIATMQGTMIAVSELNRPVVKRIWANGTNTAINRHDITCNHRQSAEGTKPD